MYSKSIGSVSSVGSICKDDCFNYIFFNKLNQHHIVLNQHFAGANQHFQFTQVQSTSSYAFFYTIPFPWWCSLHFFKSSPVNPHHRLILRPLLRMTGTQRMIEIVPRCSRAPIETLNKRNAMLLQNLALLAWVLSPCNLNHFLIGYECHDGIAIFHKPSAAILP